MDIGLVKQSFRLQGGGERQIGYLLDGLRGRGHRVQIFGGLPPPIEPVEGLMYHHVPVLPVPRAFRALGFALMVRAALRRAGLAVVQSFERTLGQQIYRAGEGVHREWLRRKRRSLPAAARLWSRLSLFDRVLLALERRVFAETPLIVANAQRGQEEIAQHYAVPRSRLLTIYNGVDTERFHPGVRQRYGAEQRTAWGISAGELVLLYVGAGFHRKGLATVIEALAQLRVQNVTSARLVVVGKGRLAPYRLLARRLGVDDWVRWEGHRADVERCYAGAEVFVLPTLYDPFANTCLEAMACGLPVVTSAANGAAELLEDGVNGHVLSDTPTAKTLADTLRQLLQEPERRRVLGAAAVRTAREFPLSRALAETVQLYEAIAARHVLA